MKLCLAAGLALLVVFAGCANQPQVPAPAQLAQTFCPVVNADLAVLAASPLLNADQRALLNDKIIPGNKAVCAAGAAINVADLKEFNATVFPALIGLVSALPMLPDQPAILLGLTLAQPILTQVIDSLPAVAVPASAASA